MIVYKVEHYTSDEGRNVVAQIPNDGSATKYMGMVTVMGPQGPMPIQFPFPDSCTTVSGCYEVFDDTFKDYVEEKQREAKSRIIRPEEVMGKPPGVF
jgi:hypothetical protein